MFELVKQGGKWYRRITSEQAFDIRFDVQLWYMDGGIILRDWDTPDTYREAWEHGICTSDTGTHYISRPDRWWNSRKLYIQADSPDKEEYTPVE